MRLVSPASFGIIGDLNVELGMMCTDENDIKELNEMYGLLCWQRYDHDLGGLNKTCRTAS